MLTYIFLLFAFLGISQVHGEVPVQAACLAGRCDYVVHYFSGNFTVMTNILIFHKSAGRFESVDFLPPPRGKSGEIIVNREVERVGDTLHIFEKNGAESCQLVMNKIPSVVGEVIEGQYCGRGRRRFEVQQIRVIK